MASAAAISSSEPEPKVHASDISSIKVLAESKGASLIPSTYHSITQLHDDVADELAASIPLIDFSLLTSNHPQIHTKTMHQLGKACAEWGFFMIILPYKTTNEIHCQLSLTTQLTNHGIPEKLIEEVMNKSREFHDLPTEEKEDFGDNGPFTPIRYGTSYYPQAEKVHYWRDYLKVITFPEFNFPHKPPGYREVAYDYSQKIRGVARKLLEGISESLGLESNSINESTSFDSGFQLFLANLYPPCP
uniref:Hyoscyamine 6-dioxygenase n=1 Tax=Cajanus cajan TaxID=3821 RepID=A0A151RZV1_CAJCA|nr:Hyoscyamine 6-dioxygenase [Cajanus cajan]